MTDEQLTALLRLKRYEQPPAGYFDGLLREVHRRQREELIQRPLWRIALERLQCFFGDYSLAPVSYAGALAAVVIAGVLAIHSLEPSANLAERGAVASFPPGVAQVKQDRALSLEPRQGNLISQQQLVTYPRQAFSEAPHYVIDSVPVSYDPLFSF